MKVYVVYADQFIRGIGYTGVPLAAYTKEADAVAAADQLEKDSGVNYKDGQVYVDRVTLDQPIGEELK